MARRHARAQTADAALRAAELHAGGELVAARRHEPDEQGAAAATITSSRSLLARGSRELRDSRLELRRAREALSSPPAPLRLLFRREEAPTKRPARADDDVGGQTRSRAPSAAARTIAAPLRARATDARGTPQPRRGTSSGMAMVLISKPPMPAAFITSSRAGSPSPSRTRRSTTSARRAQARRGIAERREQRVLRGGRQGRCRGGEAGAGAGGDDTGALHGATA